MSKSFVFHVPYETEPRTSGCEPRFLDNRLTEPPNVVGPTVRGRPGTPVEHRAADELAREERPRVVRRRVGVVERNPVEADVVVPVRESAEERLAVSQADAVRAEAERARAICTTCV